MAEPGARYQRPSPRERSYRWPAEWEPHEATWLAWPHDEDTWPGCLAQAEEAFATLAREIGRGETVHLLVKDVRTGERAEGILAARDATNVRLHRVETADSWFRDYGPIVLATGTGRTRERLALDFTFNAWGEKYPELLKDTAIPQRLRRLHGIPTERVDLVLEGGSIDGNGAGTVLTTEQCLLNANRNPGLTRAQIEEHVRELLAATHVVWLGAGIAGDDTDGHVDDIARFVSATTVVAAVEDDPADENHAPLQANLERLRGTTDQGGTPLTVVTLPMPGRIESVRGHRLPASYANFYVANAAVCVPTFGDPNDERALEVLGGCFPDRPVVGIRCEKLVEGMGTLHCVTQQLPA